MEEAPMTRCIMANINESGRSQTFDMVHKVLLALPLAAALAVQSVSFADQAPPAPSEQAASATAATAPASATSASATPAASKQTELDQLLAPIALYPDSLIAQMLMASTYPLEVVEAARWVQANPKVKDKALEDAMQKQSWDPSVKAMTAVPEALKQMNENLAWTQKLGDAFLADQKAVMDTIQSLRAKAVAAGNLKSSPEQKVTKEEQDGKTIYIIESTKTEVVYVPIYNPYSIYGPWWYPHYPPYYVYPPRYVYPTPYVSFHAGIFVGAAIWARPAWHSGSVNVNINNFNRYNHTNINNPNWNHNVNHRKGVAYQNPAVAQKYNRGANTRDVQSRDQFRGRADAGSAGGGGMQNRPQQDRAQPANRPSGGGYQGGGFSGAGNGASTRQSSHRGSMSRGSMGGGMRGGGWMRGGGGGRRR
jgi:hypothetical protein